MDSQQAEILVVGIENPLLDISVNVNDETIVKKYNLQMGSACLAADNQMEIYTEIWNMAGRETIPGGSCLNSIRSCNFMLKDTHPGKCAYFGCIGKD